MQNTDVGSASNVLCLLHFRCFSGRLGRILVLAGSRGLFLAHSNIRFTSVQRFNRRSTAACLLFVRMCQICTCREMSHLLLLFGTGQCNVIFCTMEWILLDLPQPAVFKVNRDGDRFSAYLWDFSRLLVEDLTADEVLTRTKVSNKVDELSSLK